VTCDLCHVHHVHCYTVAPRSHAQYLSSKSYVSVDWARLSKSYDNTFGTRTASGGSRAPSVQGVWNRIVDFVTANFQRESGALPSEWRRGGLADADADA
jgi:hypothetical protein